MHKKLFYFSVVLFATIFSSACRTAKEVTNVDFIPVTESVTEIVAKIPNYESSLLSAKGKGKAIVSEPGNSEHVTINFETDAKLSVLTIKNRIGIEGGKILVDEDSILIYNKIDKIAQKTSVKNPGMTNLNELASVNILDLLNFKIRTDDVKEAVESDGFYILKFVKNGGAKVNKETGFIEAVSQSPSSGLPYSAITYESYSEIDGYTLPRKITIFSVDGTSKVIFQIRSLEINPKKLDLEIDIPSDITIQRS